MSTRAATSAGSRWGWEKTRWLSSSVAARATLRPASSNWARVVRRSDGCGTRCISVLGLEAVDRVGHAGGVDLESGSHLVERERTGAAEHQQHQHLVAGEGEPMRAEHLVDSGQVDLLRPKHRGHRGHAVRRFLPAVCCPLPLGLGDRVERQRLCGRQEGSFRHGPRHQAWRRLTAPVSPGSDLPAAIRRGPTTAVAVDRRGRGSIVAHPASPSHMTTVRSPSG